MPRKSRQPISYATLEIPRDKGLVLSREHGRDSQDTLSTATRLEFATEISTHESGLES